MATPSWRWAPLLLGLTVTAARGRPPPTLQDVDARLYELSAKIQPLRAVQPTNAEAQRADFLAGRLENPRLCADTPVGYDPAAVEAELRALEIPAGPIGDLLRGSRRALLLANRVVQHRGTKAVRWATEQLNGRPSARLVRRAEGLLAAVPPPGPSQGPRVSGDEFLAHLRDEVRAYGLDDWTVEVMQTEGSTHVSPAHRAVRLARVASIPAEVPPRLAVHEVGVHVLRAANGYLQPYRIFATGTAGYQDTEEGLAAYCEVVTGTTETRVLRKYAARVLAIDSMVHGASFRATFTRLRDHQVEEGTAWETTVRAFRGGGYAKDHVYLEGLFRVLDYVEAGGALEDLFVGKIRVAEVAKVRALVEAGVLRPARYLPRRLADPPADGGAMLRLLKTL